MKTRAYISVLLMVSTLSMIACWIAIYRDPHLGFNDSLTAVFLTVFLLGWLSSVGSIIWCNSFARTWHSILCMLFAVAGLAMNMLGCFLSMFVFGAAMR